MSEEVIIESPAASSPAPRRDHRRPARKPAPARAAVPRTSVDAAKAGVASAASLTPSEEDRREPGKGGDPITRVSRNARSTDRFAIPGTWRKPGWDYQWWTHTVMGQPTDSSNLAEIHEGGWRPVLWRDVPQPWNPGAKEMEQVVRYGQGLYSRPMQLTQEAKREEYEAAEQQKRDRVIGALEGRVAGAEGVADIKGVRPVNLGLSVEGEVGSMAPTRQR